MRTLLEGSLAIGLLACLSACASVDPNQARGEILLNANSSQVVGWFSAKGEWTVFPTEKFSTYNPYTLNENTKCVSLVNDTGKERGVFRRFNRKMVRVTGVVKRYEDLSASEDAGERLLGRVYFKNEPVQNFCLRDLIFIAKDIEEI